MNYVDWSLERWREACDRAIAEGKKRHEETKKLYSGLFKLSPEMEKRIDRKQGTIFSHIPFSNDEGILGGMGWTAPRSVGWSYDPNMKLAPPDMHCRCTLPPLLGSMAPRIDFEFLQTGIFADASLANPFVYPYTRQQKKESIFNIIKQKQMNDQKESLSAGPDTMRRAAGSLNKRKINPIEIVQVDNGYIVKVGCKTVVVENSQNLLAALTEYIFRPEEVEDIFERTGSIYGVQGRH